MHWGEGGKTRGLRMAVWTAGFFLLSSAQIPQCIQCLCPPPVSAPFPPLYQDLLVQPRILPFAQLCPGLQLCLSASRVPGTHTAFFIILPTSTPHGTLPVVGLPQVSVELSWLGGERQ